MARNRFRSRCQLSKYRIGKTTPLVTICSVPVRFLRIGNLRLIRQVSLFFCLLFFSVGTQAAESLITLEHDSSFRQVYLIPDISSDLIQVTVVFTVGEVDYDGPEGLSHYLESLDHKHRAEGLITVCVKPGFVKTGMTEGLKAPPFAGEPEGVARRVLSAIDRGDPVVYAPFMWGVIMGVIKSLPRLVMRRVGF